MAGELLHADRQTDRITDMKLLQSLLAIFRKRLKTKCRRARSEKERKNTEKTEINK